MNILPNNWSYISYPAMPVVNALDINATTSIPSYKLGANIRPEICQMIHE